MKSLDHYRYNKNKDILTRAAFLALCLCNCLNANAEDKPDSMWKKNLQYHGFITQAFIKTDENNYYGDSQDISSELTEIGINGSSRINSRLLVSAQILSRRAGESYDGSAEIDYALIDYSLLSTDGSHGGLRIGRFKNPLGLYNDTRDVAYTRPGIFLPQSIYYDNLRNALLSNDGILMYSEYWRGDHRFDFQLGIGRSTVDVNLEYALIGEDIPGNLTDKDNTIVSRLLYEYKNFTTGLSYANTSMKIDNTIPQIGNGRYDIDIWILSIQYLLNEWTLTAEWGSQPLEWSGFSSFFPLGSSGDNNPGGYFVQANYRIKQNIELLIRYEEGYTDRDDRDGTEREAILASLPVPVDSPSHNYFTKDITIGARFDITNQFMIRAEIHNIEGTSIVSRRENNPATTIKDWNMYSILASYRF